MLQANFVELGGEANYRVRGAGETTFFCL